MNSLYVSSLPFGSTEESLVQLFSRFGRIQSVAVFADWENPTYEPYAVVEFGAEDGSAGISRAVAEMDGLKIGATHLRVHEHHSR